MPSSTQYQDTVPVGKLVKVMFIQLPAGAGLLPHEIEIDGADVLNVVHPVGPVPRALLALTHAVYCVPGERLLISQDVPVVEQPDPPVTE